jgi:putative CocE/NonD family hydrolase
MKLHLFFLLAAAFCGSVRGQAIDSAWVRQNYTKQEVQIPMRDGIHLFTAVYAPKNQSEAHPILMVRTPYSVAPYGTTFSSRLHAPHWANYLREGYILVLQDVRGCYMSEGQFMDVRPLSKPTSKGKKTNSDEPSDTYDAIDWCIKNIKNNNGRVGIFGISYPGFYSTMGALSGHPALKAVSPQAPVTDWFLGDDFHHNGAFALMDAFAFYSGFGRPRPSPTTKGKPGYVMPGNDNYDFFLKTGAVRNFTTLLGDSIAFWNELIQHPDYDDWWKARDARRNCYQLKPALMVVGGSFDAEDCYGAWNLYKAIEKQSPTTNNRLVMGPWFHGGWSRGDGSYLGNIRFGSKTATWYQDSLELPFFNYHLKGKGSLAKAAEASIFFSGENNWKSFDQWPPLQMKQEAVYLHSGQRLSFEKPVIVESAARYTSDPAKPVPYTEHIHPARTREYMSDDQRFAARRPDVLVYELLLEEDLTLAGPVTADLKVQLSSSDADFVVKLIDVFPIAFKYDEKECCKGVKTEAEMGGYQMLVRGEIFRGRYRQSFEHPAAFTPGQTETVKFDLPDVAHTFKKGHTLMIQVQSSWFPLFDRNPQQFVNIYKCPDTDFKVAEIKVLQQADAASCIYLPILKK